VTGLTDAVREALLCDCDGEANSLACPGHTPSALHLWTEKPAVEILAAAEAILADRLAAHETREARVRALAETFAGYAEERAALAPVGATGRLDAMDRRESGTWARAAGLLLDALDGSPA